MDGKGEAEQLYHEIENYDSSTGELISWVNIPNLTTTADTIFYMYYGNPECSSQEDPTKAWDSNYVAVIHMNDATTSTVNDSTINFNNGYKYNSI